MAQITLSLEEYQVHINARQDAERQLVDKEKELAQYKTSAATTEDVKHLTQLTRKLITIAQFAVGNLPPESIRNWPAKTLQEIAALLPHLPDYSIADNDLAIEFQGFAHEALRYERRRNVVLDH